MSAATTVSRYYATGKRKNSIARVWLMPGSGKVTINEKSMDQYFSLDIADSYSFVVVASGGFVLSLLPGWNLVTVPPVGYGYMANTLPGLQTNDAIYGFSNATQSYDKFYVKNVSPLSKNFAIEPNTGYWILAGGARTLNLQGSMPTGPQSRVITVPGPGAWAIIGFNSLSTTMHANQVPSMYSPGAVSQVVFYNATLGQFKTYNPLAPSTDFVLIPGQGYWILVTGSGTLTYTP